MSKTKKRNKNSQRLARPSGWSTSDTDEIERRRLRGLNEPSQIESQAQNENFFGAYQVHSNNEQTYRVEIRSLAEPINSCDCPDHRINGLGTCKHIEATLNRLQYRRKRTFQYAAAKGSPYIEIFLDRRDHHVRIRWPEGSHRRSKARGLITPFFSDDNILAGNPLDTLPAMQRAINAFHPS
ncbi:MAG: SWIM zinc finger domain-containing protein [Candidatus Thiodiazotropha sp. (ex Lucinoma kastoroae)]|nr:SWIM zinc finger domain-containing protein [Candidatus Thiodiazotropha sp. (ex Lucinoma kastoroae)]MCU7860597.1 SWIM zinc finger domain-containing protein [Candidatus Thiodiazotropha sp. (ex Lucinoma kastoroae)]